METTLYDDDHFIHKDCINTIKRNMTLDLGSPKANKKQRFNSLLSSPDLNMLKLASPELEKMIIAQNNGLVTTTPTPTQFLFPRPPTEEQEVYARGFTDALAELQTVHPNNTYVHGIASTVSSAMLGDTSSANSITSSVAPLCASPPMCHQEFLGNIPTSSASYPTSSSTSSSASNSPFIPVTIKDEPQTVPSMTNTPPMSPINMENQERIKLERKRQRNRLAASKCRRRKLERIAKLEEKVRQMKCENSELSNVVVQLKDQVCKLKEEVMHHSRSGCQIMTTDIMASHF